VEQQVCEISFPGSSFCLLRFDGGNSGQDLMSFSMDDMTITYAPEPSSLLALCAGLLSAGAMVRRRDGGSRVTDPGDGSGVQTRTIE